MTDEEKFGLEGLTFDDVLLMPAYSEVLPTPRDISTVARLTRRSGSRSRSCRRRWTP